MPPTSGSHVATNGPVVGLATATAERFWSAIQTLCGYAKQDTAGRGDGNSKNALFGVLAKRQSSQSTNVTIAVVVSVFLTLFVVGVAAFLYRYRYSIRFRGRKKRRHRRRRHGGSKSSKSFKSGTDSAQPTLADGAPGPSEPPPPAE